MFNEATKFNHCTKYEVFNFERKGLLFDACRLLNKKFLMDVSDKENMQRFEVGILGPVEKDEIEGYIRDVRSQSF